MKVICISISDSWLDKQSLYPHITKGKIYDVIKKEKYYYQIIDDTGKKIGVWKSRFVLLEEHRNKKIDEII